MNSEAQVKKYYDKFVKENQKFIVKDDFMDYLKGNHKADELANKGMDKLEV